MDTQKLYNTILENAYEGVYFVDSSRHITFWNGGAERISGYLSKDVLGKRCLDNILNHVDEGGKKLCFDGCPLHNTIQDGQIREATVYLHHKDGHRVPVTVKSIPLLEKGEIIGAVELFIDDSEKRSVLQDVEEYKVLAMMDQLTKLPNRRYIDSYLSSKYKEFKELNIKFGVMFMDVDKFKVFNDTYGHDAGDDVLKMISKTFLAATRVSDLIGRFGGEEFVGVFTGVNETSLKTRAERLRMLIENASVPVNGEEIKVTISIGATMVKEDDIVESILKRADELLYQSKESGRNKVSIG